jgi:acyl-[acyl carrier protein]--UDP-N-acetylglucosamine O-acyltransferase
LITLKNITEECTSLTLHGSNKEVIGFCPLDQHTNKHIVWMKSFNPETQPSIENSTILTEDISVLERYGHSNSILFCENRSRFQVALVHSTFFNGARPYSENRADFWRKEGLSISEGVYISEEATIGKGTVIGPNVSIVKDVQIGENCFIDSNCVIGAKGLGLEWNGEKYLEFPQVCKVIIGNECVIGPLSTIRRGALVDTIVSDHVQIGSLCNIGHNVNIGMGALLTSSVCLSGSVTIGERAFLGVGCTVKNKVNVGARVTIGQGCVVVQDITDDLTVVGNPARIIS